MGPTHLVLRETTPGRYELDWTVPQDVDLGTYQVNGHLLIGTVDYLAGVATTIRLEAPAPAAIAPGRPNLPPPPPSTLHPVGPGQASHTDLPQWAADLANIIAYAVVFYGVTAGLHAINLKFGWLVAAALLGVVWMLRQYLVEPIANLIKGIILTVFHILVELVDFLATWLRGIIEYFQGDLVKAVTRILLLAAFAWVWEFAQTIPMVKNILDTITEVTGKITGFINEGIDGARRFIHEVQADVDNKVGASLDRMGDIGHQLRGEVLDHVDSLFGGLSRRVGAVRVQLLSHIDLVQVAFHARVTILGQSVALMPRNVHDRIAAAYRKAGEEQVSDTLRAFRDIAAKHSPPGAQTTGVWDVVDEVMRDIRAFAEGYSAIPRDWVGETRAEIRAVQAGNPPDRGPWPEVTLDQEYADLPEIPRDQVVPEADPVPRPQYEDLP